MLETMPLKNFFAISLAQNMIGFFSSATEIPFLHLTSGYKTQLKKTGKDKLTCVLDPKELISDCVALFVQLMEGKNEKLPSIFESWSQSKKTRAAIAALV